MSENRLVSRRTILRTLAASGFVSAATVEKSSWIKPVVETVVLPAHAQTSTDSPPGSIDDPCDITVICQEDGQILVEVEGEVIGDGDLSGIQIDIVFRLNGGNEQNATTSTGADGSWGPVQTNYNATSGNVSATISSPDVDFDPPTCRTSFNCDESPPPEECSDEWDRSSFVEDDIDCEEFTASFCNGQDSEAALCPVEYDILYDENTRGTPSFNKIGGGTVDEVPIDPGDCRTIDFSGAVETNGSGRYRIIIHQHPGHPGTGEVTLGTCTVEEAE